MILPIAAAISAIAALLVARLIYVSIIKVTEDSPTGIFFGLIAPVGGGIIIWAMVLALIVSIFDAFIESDTAPEDFPYKEEIPLEDAVFSSSEGLLYYIALDGTYQNTTSHDIYVGTSPDDRVHFVSMYRTDSWLTACEQYAVNILVPDAEGKSKEDAMEEAAQARLEIGQRTYAVLPHFDDVERTEAGDE